MVLHISYPIKELILLKYYRITIFVFMFISLLLYTQVSDLAMLNAFHKWSCSYRLAVLNHANSLTCTIRCVPPDRRIHSLYLAMGD